MVLALSRCLQTFEGCRLCRGVEGGGTPPWQIRNAVLDTAYLGALDSYLRCKAPYYNEPGPRGSLMHSGSSTRAAMAQEVEMFGLVQKTEGGFELLHSIGKKHMKQLGVKTDLWILPEGMKMYISQVGGGAAAPPNPPGAQGSRPARL